LLFYVIAVLFRKLQFLISYYFYYKNYIYLNHEKGSEREHVLLSFKKNRRIRKMQNLKGKSIAIFITLILSISTGASVMLQPTVSAHSPPWIIKDQAYIELAPNPIGVGQTMVITIWTAQPLANSQIQDNIRKANYTLIITAPDGTNTTLLKEPYATNTGGEDSVEFVPTVEGNYTATFIFGGMTYPSLSQVISTIPLTAAQIASINAYAGDIFTPSTAVAPFTVQQQPLQTTIYPMPAAYWTRPIEGQNWNWYTIASNWLGSASAQFGSFNEAGYNNWQPDGTAPNSSHIMWTRPLEFGGVVGGSNTVVPGATYYSGSSYQPRFTTPIIMNGYLYYKMPFSDQGSTTVINGVYYAGAFVCFDLRTGQIVWSNSNPAYYPTWGQLVNIVNPNQSGDIPSGYLWQSFNVNPSVTIAPGVVMSNTTWIAYDGFTGSWVMNITNVPNSWTQYGPDGTMLAEQTIISAYGPAGELLRYVLDYNTVTQKGWLALWNSTSILENPLISMSEYRPVGTINDGSIATAYSWNVTINGNLDGLMVNSTAQAGVSLTGPSFNAVLLGDVLFGTSSSLSESVGPQYTPNPFTMFAINLNASKGAVGQILWVQNYTAPDPMGGAASSLGAFTQRIVALDPITRVVTMMIGETMEWVGYSVDTGSQLWGPTTTPFPDGYQYFGSGLGIGQNAIDAYGKIYVQGYGGEVWCYDTSNGNLLWQFGNGGEGNSTSDGINSPWGLLPTMVTAVADGKVYVYSQQHGNGAQSPYYKGEMIWVLNATTGQQIWSIPFQGPNSGGPGYPEGLIADGEFVEQNMYDNQIYAFGQGPTATTVTAPQVGVTTATPVTIRGTVMDISAGTKQNQQATDFPNGVPAVSEASQSAWMQYVYMQKPMPTNVTGVPVQLWVLDANNNFRSIGTATTDASGMFTYNWTPDIPGAFTVHASFAGSNSYWGSSAETSFITVQAPSTPAPTAIAQTNVATTTDLMSYIVGGVIAIIIAIAIATVLLLRRKP
jgi:outer membrane protein assembly factor BamB